ncbi:PTS sugar transporter subunit IIB [Paenibacillus thalictri]|uniref:PTS sugar transporter subunit IIB n=1 Tax=Paenibacillus thalictri TaxID=2527873 RepID=A0A4Q9DXD4_9BACL|nr:PTS sugar transporter subunit IIB [Paenibacillus thalictri]TBL81769.1 PTS sugar transporter subunit IIB [Paenibacillus thalictri]
MLKIVVVCTSGLGTSLMIRLNMQALLKELGIQADMMHIDASSMYYHDADVIIGAKQIVESFGSELDVEKIPLDSITDRNHLKQQFMQSKAYLKQISGTSD